MSTLLAELRTEAETKNYKVTMVPVTRLLELRKELDNFSETEELNGFQKWIFRDVYPLDLSKEEFPVNSLILVAVPHPMYVNVIINYQGRKYQAKGLGVSDMETVDASVKETVKSFGFQLRGESWHMPLKRLCVQSGLATYGRNNVTYVDGFGSSVALAAYLTDAVSEIDVWRTMNHADICNNCNLCISACPTGAIRQNRFLIDNERCLSCLNEGGGEEFPDWLPKEVHHTLYDCLRCQEKCPMNLKVIDPNEVIQTVEFSEEETEQILAGKGEKDFTEEFVQRVKCLGSYIWSVPLARNVKAIIDAAQ